MIRGTYQKLYPSVPKWTPDAFAETFVLGGMGPRIVGSPTSVADEMQKWIEESDIDGFSELYFPFAPVETAGSVADLCLVCCSAKTSLMP